jgi:hypothetical protein
VLELMAAKKPEAASAVLLADDPPSKKPPAPSARHLLKRGRKATLMKSRSRISMKTSPSLALSSSRLIQRRAVADSKGAGNGYFGHYHVRFAAYFYSQGKTLHSAI